jgi:hypothetical protein
MLEKVPRDASWCWPDLVAKSSHTGVDVDGLAYPLHRPTTYNHQTRGHSFLSAVVLSHHVVVGGGALLGVAKPPGLDICGGIDHLGTCVNRVLHRAHCFYQDMFTLCWNHYGVYACIPSWAAISDGDGMNLSTRVYAIRYAWALVDTSYFVS